MNRIRQIKLFRLFALTSLPALLPVLLVSLLAAATGIGLLAASAWLIASAALMPPLYPLAVGITAMLTVDLIQEKQPVRALIARQNTAVRWVLYLGTLACILMMGSFSISMTGGFAYAQF